MGNDSKVNVTQNQGEGVFRLRNVITVVSTIYYSYDHLQVETYLSEITLMTTDLLLLGR
jgi:hypothetical protein